MKILVAGATGFFGKKFISIFSHFPEYEILGTHYSQCRGSTTFMHIAHDKCVDALFDYYKPNIVIHPVAIPDPDTCDREIASAISTNILGTFNIANACKRVGAKLIYISTDYVFSGNKLGYNEDEVPDPISFYGSTKATAEHIIKTILDNYYIVRFPLFYGYNDVTDREIWTSKVINTLQKGELLEADNTQIRYPTLLDDVVLAIAHLLEHNYLPGVYHFQNNEPLTKYQFALKIAERFYLPTASLRAVCKVRSNRAMNSSLNMNKITDFKLNDVIAGLNIMKHQMEKDR